MSMPASKDLKKKLDNVKAAAQQTASATKEALLLEKALIKHPVGSSVHKLGHEILGLYHEHQRSDKELVFISLENVDNEIEQNIAQSYTYDYSSIMHYSFSFIQQAEQQSKIIHEAIREVHKKLISEGYEFIGYHGTNEAALASIVPKGFDPKLSGSGAGNARGRGFYISWKSDLAAEWADSSTQTGEVNGNDPIRYINEKGIPRLLRIYVKDFKSLILGRDLDWGIQCVAGDVNGNLNLKSSGGSHCLNFHDLELVFRPHIYSKLVAIPSLGATVDEQSLGKVQANWPSHTDNKHRKQSNSRRKSFS